MTLFSNPFALLFFLFALVVLGGSIVLAIGWIGARVTFVERHPEVWYVIIGAPALTFGLTCFFEYLSAWQPTIGIACLVLTAIVAACVLRYFKVRKDQRIYQNTKDVMD